MAMPGLLLGGFFFFEIKKKKKIIYRMARPVRRGGQSIHWAASPSRSNKSPATSSRLLSQSPVPIYFSPGDH
jgi:hypothetical protein